MPIRFLSIFVLIGIAFLVGASSQKNADHLLDRSNFVLTFDESFRQPLSWCSDLCDGERWRTKYFHSGDSPLSRGAGLNGSETEIFMDPSYLDLGINPFSLSNDGLTINVRPADAKTQAAIEKAWAPGADKGHPVKFTSGMLTTEKSFRQRYGYFEARVKVPALIGGWPAFWLLGSPGTFDEIDVFEILTGQPHIQYGGHQWGNDGIDVKKSDRFSDPGEDLSQSYHVYGVLWTPDIIAYYRDDIEIARFENKGLHQPMYIIISIGMDGDWNKQEGFVAQAEAQGALKVDYIRAYNIEAK